MNYIILSAAAFAQKRNHFIYLLLAVVVVVVLVLCVCVCVCVCFVLFFNITVIQKNTSFHHITDVTIMAFAPLQIP